MWDGQGISTRTVAPSALISTADLKTHLRVDGSDDDTFIDGLLSAATDMLEGPNGILGGKAIGAQTWKYTTGRVSGSAALYLPITPATAITSIKYYDADNVQQTATTGDFDFYSNEDQAFIKPKTGNAWAAMYSRADAVEVVYTAGFATIPDTLTHALKLIVGHLYENREAVITGTITAELPLAVDVMVSLHKKGWVAA